MSDMDNFMLDCSEFMSSYNSLDSVDGQNTSWNIKVKLSRCSVIMEGVSPSDMLLGARYKYSYLLTYMARERSW